jgi:hypothetical protein
MSSAKEQKSSSGPAGTQDTSSKPSTGSGSDPGKGKFLDPSRVVTQKRDDGDRGGEK